MCIICKYGSGEIKTLDGLKRLDCSDCPLLTTIPNIEGLKTLKCYNCPLLTTIPNIEGLKVLDCFSCPWLPNENLDYKDNINLLIKTQRIAKNFTTRRRLEHLQDEILKIYFHPENKGGYFHKKEIMEFLTTIKE